MEQFATGVQGFQEGDQIKETTATVAAECAKECLSAETCVAFNFFSKQQTCSLKSKAAATLKQATDDGGKPWQSKYMYYTRNMGGCPGATPSQLATMPRPANSPPPSPQLASSVLA